MAELEPDHRYRLSDEERDEALERLRRALQEGRIGIDEHEERGAAVLGAVSNTDLVPLFEDLPRRLAPSAVVSPEPAGTAPDTAGTEAAVAQEGSYAPRRREGRGPSPHGLVFLGGFFFILWGIPAIASGSTGALIGWAIFMVVFIVPAVTVATVRGVRGRSGKRPGTGE